jgi:Raf kinase inhibitor-like YbhB/YbcL family protein
LKKAISYLRTNRLLLASTLLSVVLVLAVAGCGDSDQKLVFDPESSLISEIEISSAAFEDGGSIPIEYTCDGENSSPPLRWSDVPAGTRSITIIVDDPDAAGQIFRHWSVFNIPSGMRSLEVNQPATPELKDSIRQAQNDFGNTGYGGPCPPEGEEHEYVFFIYALSEPLELEGNATPLDVSAALRGKVTGTGSFSGMYVRR